MGFLGSALGDAGSWLGRKAGEGLGGLFGLKRGGKAKKAVKTKMVETPEKMKRGGKARLVKGSKAAKAYMAKIRRMRK